MKHPRKIIVHIATSADGYIARPDGDVAWLDRPRPKGNYGYLAFFKSVDTILWGYKTYAKGIEMGMEKGMKAAGFGPQIKNYVFSRHPRQATMATFEFVNEPNRRVHHPRHSHSDRRRHPHDSASPPLHRSQTSLHQSFPRRRRPQSTFPRNPLQVFHNCSIWLEPALVLEV